MTHTHDMPCTLFASSTEYSLIFITHHHFAIITINIIDVDNKQRTAVDSKNGGQRIDADSEPNGVQQRHKRELKERAAKRIRRTIVKVGDKQAANQKAANQRPKKKSQSTTMTTKDKSGSEAKKSRKKPVDPTDDEFDVTQFSDINSDEITGFIFN